MTDDCYTASSEMYLAAVVNEMIEWDLLSE